MKLTVWTYEGPPHVGAMRVATAMRDLHYVLHAPQGDTYADLLFTMIERRDRRPPVTYTTFQARDLGADTATLFKTACAEAYERFRPQAMIVGASCTAELIQDDPGGLAQALDLPVPVIPLELPSYQRKENWGAAETFYQIVRHLAGPCERDEAPSCNILGPTALGFRHRDDVAEISRPARAAGRAGQRRGAAGRQPGGHRPAGRGRVQRAALPRDGRAGRAPSGEDARPAFHAHDPDRRVGDAGLRRGGRRAGRGRSGARPRRRRSCGCPGGRARSTRPT